MMSVPAGHFQVSYRGDMTRRKTRWQKARLGLLLLLLFVFPFVASSYWLHIGTAVALAVPGALALSLLTGVAGQISLGNAAFLGVGATTAAVLGGRLHWPFLVVIVAAAVITGFFGALVATPSLRVRGIYLIIATLALHFVIVWGIQRMQESVVGAAGFLLPAATVGHLRIVTAQAWYFVLVVYAAVVAIAHVNVTRCRVGRAWLAIRERDIAAEIIGVPVAEYKIRAFVATSMIIGVQGGLLAYYVGVVNYEMFTLNLAISYVAMVVIGGLGSPAGAVYGATFVTALPYLLTKIFAVLPGGPTGRLASASYDVQTAIYGLLVVVVLLYEPRGLAELTRRVREYFVLWPFSRERLAEDEA